MARPRRKTATSNFGVGGRESHDASRFYERFRAPQLSTDDTVVAPRPVAEPFVHGDARHMDAVDDATVALVVTSPPYFAGKQYEEELEREGVPSSYLEYLELLTEVFAECVRTLEPGGRIAVNVANLGRKPYRSLASDVVRILEHDLGLLLRAEIVWQKGEGASGSCAWGSFRSAANPVLRDVTERVIVASKGRFDRARPVRQRAAEGLPSESTITTDDFLALTLDVWSIPAESARRVGHPAPFPVELPERLIRLYTFAGDLVLDPFMGSGSTLVAAAQLGRRYVGYDLDPGYVELARHRVEEAELPGDGHTRAGSRRRRVRRYGRRAGARGGRIHDRAPRPADARHGHLGRPRRHGQHRGNVVLRRGRSAVRRARRAAAHGRRVEDARPGCRAARPPARRPSGGAVDRPAAPTVRRRHGAARRRAGRGVRRRRPAVRRRSRAVARLRRGQCRAAGRILDGSRAGTAVIERLVPGNVVVVTAAPGDELAPLLPGEDDLVADAVHSRRVEFAAGRACARTGLRRLGIGDRAILADSRRAPRWPAEVVGSITHCAGFTAAAVALRSEVAMLGIDAERVGGLDDEDRDAVVAAGELRRASERAG